MKGDRAMKTLMTAALAISLLGGGSALAQNEEHRGEQRPPAPHEAPGGAPRGPAPGARPAGGMEGRPGGAMEGRPGGAGAPAYRPGGETPTGRASGGFEQRPGGGGERSGGPGMAAGHGGGGPGAYHPSFGAPGFRPGGPRPSYSQQYYPRQIVAHDRFSWRAGAWYGPPGFYYHRWGYGERLPVGWFAPQWFITDYWFYNLPVPPYGYAWIRSGPDALLVDVRYGQVVEAVYGVFY